MRRIIALFLTLLLLSGCMPAPAAPYVPSPTPEPTPTPAPQFQQPSGIWADWSRLQKPEPLGKIGTRLRAEPMETLTPSDSYGRLLPYIGGVVTGEYYYQDYKYGLVTESGCAVLDPVLTWAEVVTDADGGRYALGLCKVIEEEQRWALCAADGSWCTDFLYSGFYTNAPGQINLIAGTWDGTDWHGTEAACVMDFDGNVLCRLAEVEFEEPIYNFDNPFGLQYEYFNAPHKVRLAGGKWAFFDYEGKILRSEAFDGYFSEAYYSGTSVLPVQLTEGGLWGLLDLDTLRWVAEPAYVLITPHTGAFVCERMEGEDIKTYVLDEHGIVLADISKKPDVMVFKYKNGYILSEWGEDGRPYIYDLDLNKIAQADNFDLYNDVLVLYEEIGDSRSFDNETLVRLSIYDGATLTPLEGEFRYGAGARWGYTTAQYADGTGVVFDETGKKLFTVPDCNYAPNIIRDLATGEVYFMDWKNGGFRIITADGAIHNIPNGNGYFIIDGYVRTLDETGAGLVDLDGNYIFRTPIDFTD